MYTLMEGLCVRGIRSDKTSYSLSSMSLTASQLASSSPLCLFFGAVSSRVDFDGSKAGKASAVLPFCVRLTPLSIRAGCTGLPVAGRAGGAEDSLDGVAVPTRPAVASVAFSDDDDDVVDVVR